MFLLESKDTLGMDQMRALDVQWGWQRRWESWKEKGVGKARAERCPENGTVVLQGKIMMTCTAIMLTKRPKSGIKEGNKRLAPTMPVCSRGQLSP